ncbi:MAG: right-handed parallel beta-helix repeat-containing protein [Planctomycetota bacterium]
MNGKTMGLWTAAILAMLVGWVGAVTIEVDDRGGVTVHDPGGRVTLVRDTASADPSGHTAQPETRAARIDVEPAVGADAGFTAWPLHPAARRIHVANAGDDRHNGLTPQTPVRTLRRGLGLLRNGFGDQLLLRAGDTFQGGLGDWRWSGRDAQHPAVLGVYGDGDRPRIVTHGEGFLIVSHRRRVDYVAFQGLHVFPARRMSWHPAFDPDDLPYREAGVWWMGRGRHITLEDCKIQGYQNNLVFQNNEIGGIADLTIRRCIVADSYTHRDGKIGGHSTGLFTMGVDGVRVEESVFDHNGWAPAEVGIAGASRTMFNHNLYLEQTSRNLTVSNNVITRGASFGLQLRPGGEATGNLFARNALGMYFAWHPSRVVGNVVAESVDHGDRPDERRGYGIIAWPCEDGLVAENLILHKRGNAGWAGAIEVADFHGWKADVAEPRLTIRDNTIVDWPVPGEPDAIVVRHGDTEVRASGNVLDAASGGAAEPAFVRPGFTLDDAAGGSFEAWLERARSRPRGTWPGELTAAAINAELLDAYRATAD